MGDGGRGLRGCSAQAVRGERSRGRSTDTTVSYVKGPDLGWLLVARPHWSRAANCRGTISTSKPDNVAAPIHEFGSDPLLIIARLPGPPRPSP